MKIGIYSFGSCEGCRYALIGSILQLSRELDLEIAYEPLLGLNVEQPSYDIVVIEGAVCTLEDIRKLRELRSRAKYLVALGSCAVVGGIPGNKKFTDQKAVDSVYRSCKLPKNPVDVKPLSAYVKVDYWIRGCPPTCEEFGEVFRRIISGILFKQYERRLEYCRENTIALEGFVIRLQGEKCIACGRCVNVCEKLGVNAIDFAYRGINVAVTTPFNISFDESTCIECGLCTTVCPVGAIHEKSSLETVQEKLSDNSIGKVYVEPESLAALSAFFNTTPEIIVGALITRGFEKVVVWKPAYEISQKHGAIVPMSEAERKLVAKFFPSLTGNLLDPPKLPSDRSCLITPCLARKLQSRNNFVLTTREAIRLLSALDLDGIREETPEVLAGVVMSGASKAVGPEEVYSVLNKVSSRPEGLNRVIELLICPGGCLYGGGQPHLEGEARRRLEKQYKGILRVLSYEKPSRFSGYE